MPSPILSDHFISAFSPDSASSGCPATVLLTELEPLSAGITDLLTRFGGVSFRNGIYRLHTPDDLVKWTSIVTDSFPEYKHRVVCFGYDWLGRHFALDKERVVAGQAQILQFDPGFHEVFQIPCSFDAFHRTELPEYADDALAAPFYVKWRALGGAVPAISECVGYRVPPILGGLDNVSNLEIIDMDVYWSLS